MPWSPAPRRRRMPRDADGAHTRGAVYSAVAGSWDRAARGGGCAQPPAFARKLASISEAAAEQSRGVEQINASTGQLDQTVQRNAAGAEQTSSAAVSLHTMAGTLKNELLGDLIGYVSGGPRQPAG